MNDEQQKLINRLQEASLSTRRFLKIDDKKTAFEHEWQNNLYTPEELDSQNYPFWGICGKDNLVLIDTDTLEMEIALRRAFPETFEVKSPRRGLAHFYIKVEGGAVPNKTLHLSDEEKGSGEIRAQKMYLVAAGTEIRYEDLVSGKETTGKYLIAKDVPIARMQFDDFMKVIEPFLGKDKAQHITFEQMRKGVPEGTRHAQGIKYATFLVGVQQFDVDTALLEMQRWNKLNQPPMDEKDLKRMVEKAFSYVSREDAKKQKSEEAKLAAEQEKKKPQKFIPFVELPDGKLVEEGFDGKDVFFLVYDPMTGRTTKVFEIDLEDLILKPIDNDEVRNCTVLLPSEAVEYGSEEQLTEEMKEYLNRWHEPPDQLSRTLDVYYSLLTYVHDLIPQLPYRRYLAPWGKGKSAWLEALGWICYRGIVLAGSDTDKSVVRKMNNWRGTALIDEADFGDSTLYAFLTKILNIGYDRKTGFYHRSDDNDPNKVISYMVFCPKLLATREKYKDLALESRCLTTIGRQNVDKIPLFRMDKFVAESQLLRNKLIMWRFRNYRKIKEEAAKLEDKDLAGKVYDGADGLSSRVKQVILPLWLIVGDSMKQTLTSMAKTFDNLLKIEDPDYLLELQAKDAVTELVNESEEETVNVSNVSNVLIHEAGDNFYALTLVKITRKILENQGITETNQTNSEVQSISKRLKDVFESTLGFSIRIGQRRSRVVLIPAAWIQEDKKPSGLEVFLEPAPRIRTFTMLSTFTDFIASLLKLTGDEEEVEVEESIFQGLLKTHGVSLTNLFDLRAAGILRTSLTDPNLSAEKGFVKIAVTKEGEK